MSAVPLVMLHGALSSGSQLRPLAAELGDVDATTPDLAGHGDGPARPYVLEDFVDTVMSAAPEQVDLVGYSLGGYVALAAAIAYPDRVRRVVTIATKLAWTPEIAAAEAAKLDPDRLAAAAPGFVTSLEERHPGPGWRSVVDNTRTFIAGLGTAPPLALDRVEARTLILVGDADTLVTVDECRAAARAMPDAVHDVIPGAPHQLERIDLGDLGSRVRSFLGH